MITVIMTGGSGTRLWPLSTKKFPKQFLTLVGEESLLQSAFKRAKTFTTIDKIYVIPVKDNAHLVREQLSEIPEENFIVEPGLRGTANCIVAGVQHIQSRHDKDEPIAFLHADHFIRDVEGFEYSFKHAGEASKEHGRVTLIGIEPTYPATGFGYIHKADELSNGALVYNVSGFKEKPAYDVAQDYMQSGHYLWNCGYFVGSVNTFLAAFEEFAPKLKEAYEKLSQATDEKSYEDTYLSLESDMIDYALLERAKNLLVVPASFDWMDLGSFKDAHEAVEKNEAGNYVHGEGIELDGVENSFIRNDDSEKPVAVIGLDNVVVVNTPHGLLVARKDLSQKVGDIAKKIQAK